MLGNMFDRFCVSVILGTGGSSSYVLGDCEEKSYDVNGEKVLF